MTVSAEFLNGILLGAVVAGLLVLIIVSYIFGERDKCYQYVSPGTEVIHKKQWENIEDNISREVAKARTEGIRFGRRQVMEYMEDSLRKKKCKLDLRSPYQVLGLKIREVKLAAVKAQTLITEYEAIKKMTPDAEVWELCDVRIKQIEAALKKIEQYNKVVDHSSGDI